MRRIFSLSTNGRNEAMDRLGIIKDLFREMPRKEQLAALLVLTRQAEEK